MGYNYSSVYLFLLEVLIVLLFFNKQIIDPEGVKVQLPTISK